MTLKVLKSKRVDTHEDLAAFLRETRTVAGLDHAGIVSVFDVVHRIQRGTVYRQAVCSRHDASGSDDLRHDDVLGGC